MRVHWRKGLENFQSFFHLLAEARDEVGNSALPNWCFDEIGVGFSRITQVARCLREDDQLRIRQDLAQARQAERSQRQAQRRAREQERQERQAQRLREQEERRAEERRERARESNRRYYRRRRDRQVASPVSSVSVTSSSLTRDVSSISESELAQWIKAAWTRVKSSRSEWVEASVELAGLLVQARRSRSGDREFGAWLEANDIDINHSDRSALIHLGQDLETMRRVLDQTDRRSYQLIWEEARARLN